MPVYRCKILGEDKPRLIRAASAAAARSSLVDAETVTAEEMADLMADGAKLETSNAPAEPPEKGELVEDKKKDSPAGQSVDKVNKS